MSYHKRKCIYLVGDGVWDETVENRDFNNVARDGSTGILGFVGPNTMDSKLLQILGFMPVETSGDSFSQRFCGMKARALSNSDCGVVFDELDLVHECISPNDCEKSAKDFALNLLDSTDTDLGLIYLSFGSSVCEKESETRKIIIDSLSGVVHAVQSKFPDTLIVCVFTETFGSTFSINTVSSNAPPQSVEIKGKPSHFGLLAVHGTGITRQDCSRSLNSANEGAYGKIAALNFMHEIAYIIGFSHKYGA